MFGYVKWFDRVRNFGFIFSEEIGGDLFVHTASIVPDENGMKILSANDQVTFDYKKEDKGLKAVNVKVRSRGEKDAHNPK